MYYLSIQSSQSLWSRLAVLLNFLPAEADLRHMGKYRGLMEMLVHTKLTLCSPLLHYKAPISNHLQIFGVDDSLITVG